MLRNREKRMRLLGALASAASAALHHFARDPMTMPIPFPLVPEHEIAGVVTKVLG